MKLLKLLVLAVGALVFEIHVSSCFEIFRSACRKYGLFKITDRNIKITGGLVSAVDAVSLSFCLKYCLDSSTCKTFNFKANSSDMNCELLSVTRSVAGTSVNANGWKHYEPIQQSVTPGCMRLGSSNACSPGYRCEDSCDANARFKCIDINECDSNPCLNGGTCNNYVNKYSCSCKGGYKGSRCQSDINECGSSPCQNGGHCHNHVNHYSCSCVNGHHGSRCENAPAFLWGGRKK